MKIQKQLSDRLPLSGFRILSISTVVLAAMLNPCMSQEVKSGGSKIAGVIVDAEGAPLAGSKVWVYTAAPRKGTGYL